MPEGKTEAEVLETIERVVCSIAPSFEFGYYGVDDVKQQARLYALEALSRYDPSRPLYNFLVKHVRNRLLNLRRDKLMRNDPPCLSCHGGSACTEGSHCRRYAEWLARNSAKANLMRPVGMEGVGEPSRCNDSHDEVEFAETLERIDAHLPIELRADYLRMREGVHVGKARRLEVMAAVREIIGGDDGQ